MLPAAVRSASASTTLSFSELNTVLVVLLCTLRGRRHQRLRNTRYRAGATPYPNRTFTGWIAPASPGAHEQLLKNLLSSTPMHKSDAPTHATPPVIAQPMDHKRSAFAGSSAYAATPETRPSGRSLTISTSLQSSK